MVQSLKARCSSCLGLGLVPVFVVALELAVDLALELVGGLAPLAGVGLAPSLAPSSARAVALVAVLVKGLVAVLAAGANSARAPWIRAARPAGSPWAAINQWCGSRRRPSNRLTTAMGLSDDRTEAVVRAGSGGGSGAGSGSPRSGAQVAAGAAGALGKGMRGQLPVQCHRRSGGSS